MEPGAACAQGASSRGVLSVKRIKKHCQQLEKLYKINLSSDGVDAADGALDAKVHVGGRGVGAPSQHGGPRPWVWGGRL